MLQKSTWVVVMIIDSTPDENRTTRVCLWYRIGLRKIKIHGKPYKVSRDTLICDKFSWCFRHH